MSKESSTAGAEAMNINSYLNTIPNLAKLNGKGLKLYLETALTAEQKSYHALRQGMPEDGDVVVWNEFFEGVEKFGKQRKEIEFRSDSIPKLKSCSISSILVLDCFDDNYRPFARVKEGGLYKDFVKIKISSKPFTGFAVRVVITAKVK